MSMSSDDSPKHVAVFPFPFGTHATPLYNITQKLASFAPNVFFSFFNIPLSNSKIFSNAHILPNIKAYDVWDGVPEGYVFKGMPQEDIELFMVAAPQTLRKAVAEAEAETGRRVTCMLGDAFLWFVEQMAQQKGVPWLTTYMSEEHSLSAHVYTDLIREKLGIHDQIAEEQKDAALDFIPGMSEIRVQDLPAGIVAGNLDSFFARMLHQMGRALPRATAVCVSSCDELDPEATNELKSTFKLLLNVGPLSLIMQPNSPTPDSTNCLAWLDEHKDENCVAYVSFGSVARPDPTEIAALAQALEATKISFLWSLKDNFKVHLPPGFLENKDKGMVVPWAPQAAVLAHKAVGVFVTHFGYNSIMESIVSEVPMIGRPFIGEQKLNGRLVEAKWGIGLVLEGGVFTKDGVIRSFNKVLRSPKGDKMRENIRGLRLLVETAVGSQGSCNRDFKHMLQLIEM